MGLFLALLAVVLFAPLLFFGRVLFFGDIALYFVPLLHFQRGELLQGRIPLWNPTLLCGTPFVGDPQAWPLYPSSLLLWVCGAPRAAGLVGVLHVLWAAVGTWAFLRRRGRSAAGALVGAVAFAFGAAFVSKLQFPNMAQAASWLPWLLWAAEGVIERGGARRVATLAACAGLALLAAHPQMFLMQLYLGLTWCLWRVWRWPGAVRTVALLALGLALGGVMAAGQLLPAAEMARESVRPGLSLGEANRFILPPYAALYNFVLPNFYGNPASDTEFVARGNFWESACYVGLLPVALAVGAAVRLWRRSGEAQFWAVAAVVCVWLALGRDAGLFAVAFRVLPGLKTFHDPARWLHPATFAIACLASLGLEALLATLRRPAARRALAVAILATSAADVLALSATLNPTTGAADFDTPARTARNLGLTPTRGRVWHADNEKVWRRHVTYRTYVGVSRPADVSGFLATLGPNLSGLAGLRDAAGYEPVRRADMDALLSYVRDKGGPASPLLPALGVSDVLFLPRPAGEPPAMLPLPGYRGRAQLWADWRTAPTRRDALRAVTAPHWDGVPVIVSAPPSPAAGNEKTPAAVLLVEERGGPDAVTVPLPDRHPAGMVVLADARHPGWTATVDGRPAPLLAANGALRAVPVPASARVIAFRYDPASWRVGMFLSLLGVGTVTGTFAGAALQGRRRAGRSRPLPSEGAE